VAAEQRHIDFGAEFMDADTLFSRAVQATIWFNFQNQRKTEVLLKKIIAFQAVLHEYG
jgi:hypothetical protein